MIRGGGGLEHLVDLDFEGRDWLNLSMEGLVWMVEQETFWENMWQQT